MTALLRGQHVVFLLGVHAVILDALECRSTSNLMCPIRIRREASRIATVSAASLSDSSAWDQARALSTLPTNKRSPSIFESLGLLLPERAEEEVAEAEPAAKVKPEAPPTIAEPESIPESPFLSATSKPRSSYSRALRNRLRKDREVLRAAATLTSEMRKRLKELAEMVDRSGGNPFDDEDDIEDSQRRPREGSASGRGLADGKKSPADELDDAIQDSKDLAKETPASTSTDISGADSTSGATAEAVVADALGEQEVAGKKSPVDELDDAIEDSKDLAKQTSASTSTDISGAGSTSGATAEAVIADALGEHPAVFQGDKSEYCEKYETHYGFFCKGADKTESASSFCSSYSKACPNAGSAGGSIPQSTFETTSAKTEDGSSRTPTLNEEEASLGLAGVDEKVVDTGKGFKVFQGEISEYCEKYALHYSRFCAVTTASELVQLVQFCGAFKKACPGHVGSAVPLAKWPENPFSKEITVNPAPAEAKAETAADTFADFEDSWEKTEAEAKVAQEKAFKRWRKIIPCKPDCDKRIYPHCTTECKCDYIYPAVQRFCNPPPLPLFLNTCRLWYWGCPKYEQYHYASQFIYSKAEKGKVLPGQVGNPNPFGIAPGAFNSASAPAPAARGAPTETGSSNHTRFARATPPRPERALIRKLPEDESEITMLDWPTTGSNSRETTVDLLLIVPPEMPLIGKSAHLTLLRNALAKHRTKHRRAKQAGTELLIPPQTASEKRLVDEKAKARQVPVVPSDAAYGAGEVFNKFDGYTDSHGILHRTRSRSPFTKPGLWEPNPDDPHNRDHANKYWYRPESVGVDWLNGQLAWGAHWAVPAAGVGGTDGFSAVHFPSIGTFLGIPDDYD